MEEPQHNVRFFQFALYEGKVDFTNNDIILVRFYVILMITSLR